MITTFVFALPNSLIDSEVYTGFAINRYFTYPKVCDNFFVVKRVRLKFRVDSIDKQFFSRRHFKKIRT